MPNHNTPVPDDSFWREKIFCPVAKRVLDQADSLREIARFPKAGIEGWLKVEAVWALSDLVAKLQNKGPDLKEPLKKSFTIRFRYDSLALTERIALDAAQFCRV